MREILFRGKTYDNEWEIGCLHYEYGETDRNGKRTVDYRILGMRGECRYVMPETVGQYTGLTDKNGKKIFEGDIVQYYGTYPLEVYIEKGHPKVRCFDTVTNTEYTELFFGYDEEIGECEVIGNIHDNPELMESE